jgi:multidrug resistance protein, MATE family
MTETAAMLRLAAPLALQQAGVFLMGVVDSAILGRYSDAALAGSGVGNNLWFVITSIGMGVIMGLDTVVPHALGAGRHADARRALQAGIRLAIVVGLVMTIVVLAAPVVLVIAKVDSAVEAEARPYVYVRAIGTVPYLLSVALRSYLSAHSITRPLVVAVVVGNIVNAALAVVLVFGIPAIGLPSMGVIGAGLATALVQILMFVMFIVAVRGLETSASEPRERPTRADMSEIIRYGLPVGGHIFAEVSTFSLATVLAGSIGKVSAAAHTIVLNTASLSFACTVGIASATSVRVGLAVGAQNIELARRRGLLGLGMGAMVMGTSALIFLLAPRLIASLFTRDVAVTAMTVTLLHIVPLFQLSDGTQAIAAGALRGLGTTRVTFIGNVIGHYVIGLPLMIVLAFTLDLRARGLWLALSAGLTATAAILAIAFLRNTSRSRR